MSFHSLYAPNEKPSISVNESKSITFEAKGKNKRCYIFDHNRKKQWMQWWTKTAWVVKNQVKPDSRRHTINWGSLTRKSDKWDHYKDCALVSSGKFNIICRHCDEIIIHPSTGHGTNGMAIHLKSKKCTKKSRMNILQQTDILDGYRNQVRLQPECNNCWLQ